MKIARILVLGVALGAGGIAAMLAGNQKPPAPTPAQPIVQLETTDVLVANADIGIGTSLKQTDISWQPWPTKYVSANFIRKTGDPKQTDEILGTVARAPFVVGEPIREAKLIKTNGSGYMAAILPPGMRAVSTEITPEAGAGGFILPNDRVDVILTSAEKDGRGKEFYKSQTILTDVLVLAIDQTVEEKSGKKTALGKIATLELNPSDAEKLSLARRLGTIFLTLRGLTEGAKVASDGENSLARQESVTIIRFGQASSN